MPFSTTDRLTAPSPRKLPLLVLATTLATLAVGCVRVPELEDQLTSDLRGSAYPDLVPLDTALATTVPPHQQSTAVEQSLTARAAALQQRADALRAATP
ncbi:hypothetical protein [Phaeobacter sp.]|uniref:hypothetical protein n=1 Tax=Phaeobacter sp. TaxID=1902409 RepID=UPI0025F9A784|nr:hypothetical protein [Phaeobacter sp.]